MTGEEFEARVDAILAEQTGHAAHRALDLLTNELLFEMGGGYERGTRKWLAMIEGQHEPGQPYPLRDSGSDPKGENSRSEVECSDHDRLCERLRVTRFVPLGSGQLLTTELINPDGPEAATLIESQAQQIATMREALSEIAETVGHPTNYKTWAKARAARALTP